MPEGCWCRSIYGKKDDDDQQKKIFFLIEKSFLKHFCHFSDWMIGKVLKLGPRICFICGGCYRNFTAVMLAH